MKRLRAILSAAILVAGPACVRVCGDQVVPLVAGENFFGLACEPADASIGSVFRDAKLPAGKGPADSAVLEVYAASPLSEPAASYRLDQGGHWLGARGSVADGEALLPGRGYCIVLPPSSGPVSLTLRGKPFASVPALEIAGSTGATNFTVLAWPYPVAVAARDLGLIEAGLKGGVNVQQSDEIRVLDNSRGMGSRQAPKARIWINKAGQLEFSPTNGPAADYIIEPGEALIIVRKRAPALSWHPALPPAGKPR